MKCGKRCMTERECIKALEHIRKDNRDHRKEFRYYECDPCQSFHLSSMPLEFVDNELGDILFKNKWRKLLNNAKKELPKKRKQRLKKNTSKKEI